jgi:SAM-dependent methyltransferase
MSQDVFRDVAPIYEALVDWPKRLANEGPFYRRLFDKTGVQSVVDVACGTGHHAAIFHSWGLRVEAADLSQNMLDRARANFGESSSLHWVLRGFDQPIEPPEPLDAAICVGNSLALAPDRPTVQRVIRQMLAALRLGGVAVLHVLNLWRLPDGPCQWQKSQRVTLECEEVLVVKGVHRSGAHGFVDLIVASLASPSEMRTESIPLLGLEADELHTMCCDAGASTVLLFGNYEDAPYERSKSVDLIVVAWK